MCGIAGIYSADGHRVNLVALEEMIHVLGHRGPDGKGIFYDDGEKIIWSDAQGKICKKTHPWPAGRSAPKVALGHCRLAIIELGDLGHQPMCDIGHRFWIVYNGEVYNYLELRAELTSAGYNFLTRTDTEVIITAWRQWGYECLNRFNGMWSFAIWDAKDRKLNVARDRFGVKPFYYCFNQNAFVFASELKALAPITERKVDDAILGSYLSWGTVEIDPTRTFLSGIRKLQSGHYAIIQKGEIASISFWTPSIKENTVAYPDFEGARTEFLNLFNDAVNIRLRSDVPVGSSLSGGLDSSSIVCTVASLLRERREHTPQHTVTADYGGTEADEWRYAEIAADAAGAIMHKARCGAEDFRAELFRIVEQQDEPFPGLSVYAQWCVFREAKKNKLKVMLDGQGADELLAGYEPWTLYFKELLRSFAWAKLSREIQKVSTRSGIGIAHTLVRYGFSPNGRIAKIRRVMSADRDMTKLLTNDLRNAAKLMRINKAQERLGSNANLLDQWNTSSLPALLRFADRNSMAHSVEVRLPFLDYRLMQHCFSLPIDYKLRDGWTKAILRDAVRDIVPQEVRYRPVKMGFPTPQRLWIISMQDGLRELLLEKRTQERGWFDGSCYRREINSRSFFGKTFSWWAVNAEVWARQLIDRPLQLSPLF